MRFLAEAASTIPIAIVVDIHTGESFHTTDCYYRRVAFTSISATADLLMLTF